MARAPVAKRYPVVKVGNYAQNVDMTGEAGDILRSVQKQPDFSNVKAGSSSTAPKPKKKR